MATRQRRRLHYIIITILWGVGLASLYASVVIKEADGAGNARAVLMMSVGAAVTLTVAGLYRLQQGSAAECWQAGYRAGLETGRAQSLHGVDSAA